MKKCQNTKSDCSQELPDAAERNNYYSNKQLTLDSFKVEQQYHIQKRHLLNRAIHGWGVAYGFDVSFATKDGKPGFCVESGLALDKCGRELLFDKDTIGIEDLIFLDENGAVDEDGKCAFLQNRTSPEGTCWLLSAHYAEELQDKVEIDAYCDWEVEEWDRVIETVKFSFTSVPAKRCEKGILPCNEDQTNDFEKKQADLHAYICEKLKSAPEEQDCCKLFNVDDPCGPVRIDTKNGVPIACVTFSDGCDEPDIENCIPKKFVKNNDLLFDLIEKEKPTTRIAKIGWEAWHRKTATHNEFFKAVEPASPEFWIRFDGPIKRETIEKDCIVMRVISSFGVHDFFQSPYRVPITEIEIEDSNLPSHVIAFRPKFDGKWLKRIAENGSEVLQSEFRVEIEIRGDFILDNLESRIVRWTKTPYRYLKRQSVYNSGHWTDISDSRHQVAGY